MKIQTNRLQIKFNIPAIEKDFIFFRFERNAKNKWFGAKVLDELLGEKFKAQSVLFEYGKYAYVMFKNNQNSYELRRQLRELDEDSQVIKVVPKASYIDGEDQICEAWLAQILINSLASPQSERFSYCNLTGKLLIVTDNLNKQKKCLDVAKVNIDKDFLLKISIVRFRALNSFKGEILKKDRLKPHYQFDATTNTLKRTFKQKTDPKLTYIQKGFANKKASRTFLDFSSYEKFTKSRAGIFHNVMTKIESKLSKYMEVTLSTREVKGSDDYLALESKIIQKGKDIKARLKNQKIHLVNRIKDKDSLESANLLINKIREELINKYIANPDLITKGKRDNKESLNIRIIHDQDFYDNPQDDEYQKSTQDYVRQNITVELIQGLSKESEINQLIKPLVKTVIKEQLIKRDISQRKLELFDWTKLQAQGDWIFANRFKEKIEGQEQENEYLIFVTIHPDGKFEFEVINPWVSLIENNHYPTHINYIKDIIQEEQKPTSSFKFEGFVISDSGDINLIFNTDEITIPQLEAIQEKVKQVDKELPQDKNTGNALANLVEKFREQHSQDKMAQLPAFLKLEYLIEELEKIGHENINKNNLRNLLNKYIKGTGSKTVDTEIRNYLLNQHQIRVHFSKNFASDKNDREQFEALLDIKYYGETKTEAYYSVGVYKNNIQSSIENACHLRKVVAIEDSQLIFKEILKTMDVDFVRTGQSTVIPFPFKYIREYQKMKDES